LPLRGEPAQHSALQLSPCGPRFWNGRRLFERAPRAVIRRTLAGARPMDTEPAVLHIFDHATDTIFISAGDLLYEEGERGEVMYVVKHGELDISIDGTHVERIGAGAIVGEMGLVSEDHLRIATVRAHVETEVVAIDRRRFMYLCERSPYFALEVMRVMARRLKAMDERVFGHRAG